LETVSVEIEPPQLARLVDFAERPRVRDWSLRAALVRYAQPEPERVNRIVELVRRIEWALRSHRKTIERAGKEIWSALQGDTGAGQHAELVALLEAAAELDRLGDILAEWAVDLAGKRPNAAVDTATEAVARRLDELGVPREEQRPRPSRRGDPARATSASGRRRGTRP
jgi:hypothetical protein